MPAPREAENAMAMREASRDAVEEVRRVAEPGQEDERRCPTPPQSGVWSLIPFDSTTEALAAGDGLTGALRAERRPDAAPRRFLSSRSRRR